jgi:DNA-binding beta-propeller fold protein YncE
MAKTSIRALPIGKPGTGRIFTWLMGVVCFGILAFLLLRVVIQLVTPLPAPRLQQLSDIPLPGILVSRHGQTLPQSVHFDRFDFQALDQQRGLLFTAHDGPSASKSLLIKGELPAGAVFNPAIVVFDVRQNKYVASINNVNVRGVAVASDIHRVYAADAGSSVIRVIDEQACQAAIHAGRRVCTVARSIDASQAPDSIEYDPDHHEVFVSESGNLSPPQGVIDVISTRTNTVIKTIKMGAGVGHIRYDAASRRVFAVIVPASGNGEVVAIDPIGMTVVARATLPAACSGAHGLAIDGRQRIAFVACVDSRNLTIVSLRTMKPVGDLNNLAPLGIKPDIVVLDSGLHVLFVGCQSAISVFDESRAASGVLAKFRDYVLSTDSSHSIAVDESTHNIYVPLTNVGNRPTMRVEHYDQNGTD